MTVHEHRIRRIATDSFALGAVALLLIAVYYLVPAEVQTQFRFDYHSPTVVTALTAAYLHHLSNPLHLWGNVAAYLLTAVPLWWIHLATGRRRRFWAVAAVILFAFPVAISTANLVWLVHVSGATKVVSFGFSGVVSGFAGYLIVSVIHYVSTIDDEAIARSAVNLIVSFVVGSLLFINAEDLVPVVEPVLAPVSWSTLVGSGVGTVYLAAKTRVVDLRSISGWVENSPTEVGVVLIGTAVFVVVFVSAFPNDLGGNGPAVNVLSHGVGLLFGVVVGAVAQLAPRP